MRSDHKKRILSAATGLVAELNETLEQTSGTSLERAVLKAGARAERRIKGPRYGAQKEYNPRTISY